MQQKCNLPFSDEVIKKAFAGADSVNFSARNFNCVIYGSISFGDLGWLLPLEDVLPLIGITPQMLRPVFGPQPRRVKRQFPFNLSWLGLNKRCYKTAWVELPEVVETYEQLGSFALSEKPFQELARILGKSVIVMRQDGSTGGHCHIFTAHPSGEIVEAVRT